MPKKATDNKTLELLKEVNRRKKEIASAEKPQYITNCNFSYSENGANVIVLHVEANIKNLIAIGAFLLERSKLYDEAATALGVSEPPPFQWQGFAVKDWMSDLRMRLTKVQIAAKKKSLEELEDRLNKIVSPELRAQMELDAISEALK